MIPWQPIAVGFNERIDQGIDLVRVQFSSSMRVEQGGMVDMLAFAGQGSFHCQRLHIDIGLDQPC